jgi:hypothetical protein
VNTILLFDSASSRAASQEFLFTESLEAAYAEEAGKPKKSMSINFCNRKCSWPAFMILVSTVESKYV